MDILELDPATVEIGDINIPDLKLSINDSDNDADIEDVIT